MIGILKQLFIDYFSPIKKLKEIFNIKVKKEPIFPCKDCLVLSTCSQICEKLTWDEDELLDKFCEYRCCPDCSEENLIKGPSGGGAINIKCTTCGHWFNVALPLFVERIHVSQEGRFRKG